MLDHDEFAGGMLRTSISGRLYGIVGAALCLAFGSGMWWQRRELPLFFGAADADTHSFLSRTLFVVAGQPVRIWFVFKTLLFLLFLHFLSRAAHALITLLLRDNSHVDRQRGHVLATSVSVSIYVIGLLIGIHVERINLNTLALVGGTLGVGIGFGLQSVVANFVAGMILLVEQPIRLGDLIEFGDRTGEVVRVGSRVSWIQTYDNAVVIIPNSELTGKQILNWTAGDPKVRLMLPISVSQQASHEHVIQALMGVAAGYDGVMTDPAPDVLLSEIGSGSITFTLRVWTEMKSDGFSQLKSNLYREMLQRLREEEISLSSSSLDLHVRSVPATIISGGANKEAE